MRRSKGGEQSRPLHRWCCLGAKIARRSRAPHVRHPPFDEAELGAEARQLRQVARQLALLFRQHEALATFREMQRTGRAEQALRPKLDLVRGEMGMRRVHRHVRLTSGEWPRFQSRTLSR